MKLLNLILQVVEFNCVSGMPTQTVAMWIYCKTFPGARRETKRNVCRCSKSAVMYQDYRRLHRQHLHSLLFY